MYDPDVIEVDPGLNIRLALANEGIRRNPIKSKRFI
jgi:hypothetical protein